MCLCAAPGQYFEILMHAECALKMSNACCAFAKKVSVVDLHKYLCVSYELLDKNLTLLKGAQA